MLVSAIDTSVHELVVSAIVRKLNDDQLTFDISKQTISIQCVLVADLRRQYSKVTFQSSRQIEAAFTSISVNKIWRRVSTRLGKSPEEVKLQLDLMDRRRNQIVHEADLDGLHRLQALSIEMMEDLHTFTTAFVNAIFDEYQSLG